MIRSAKEEYCNWLAGLARSCGSRFAGFVEVRYVRRPDSGLLNIAGIFGMASDRRSFISFTRTGVAAKDHLLG